MTLPEANHLWWQILPTGEKVKFHPKVSTRMFRIGVFVVTDESQDAWVSKCVVYENLTKQVPGRHDCWKSWSTRSVPTLQALKGSPPRTPTKPVDLLLTFESDSLCNKAKLPLWDWADVTSIYFKRNKWIFLQAIDIITNMLQSYISSVEKSHNQIR